MRVWCLAALAAGLFAHPRVSHSQCPAPAGLQFQAPSSDDVLQIEAQTGHLGGNSSVVRRRLTQRSTVVGLPPASSHLFSLRWLEPVEPSTDGKPAAGTPLHEYRRGPPRR